MRNWTSVRLRGRSPWQISFAGARQAIAASWDRLSDAPALHQMRTLAKVQFASIANRTVGDRPNRVEPRAVKRRPKPHKLLTEPRRKAREKLLAAGRKRR